MKSLKLNVLEQNQLKNQEMNAIKGGDSWICSCSCYWENSSGGSSIDANMTANGHTPGGTVSTQGNNEHKLLVVTP